MSIFDSLVDLIEDIDNVLDVVDDIIDIADDLLQLPFFPNGILIGTTDADYLYTNVGGVYVNGLDGNDYLSFTTGNNYLNGGSDNDVLSAGFGNDTLLGSSGNDYLYGDLRSSLVSSEDSLDYLDGGDGNDTLSGGVGYDTLTGGVGADTFVFNYLSEGIDVINDFKYFEGDKIQISTIGFGAFSTNQFTYDQQTGSLSFDTSSFDLLAPVQFASLQPNLGFGFIPNFDITLV